jgi:hypothetical protein
MFGRSRERISGYYYRRREVYVSSVSAKKENGSKSCTQMGKWVGFISPLSGDIKSPRRDIPVVLSALGFFSHLH